MNCFLGIDLGSTTTKVAVLDENEKLIGQGITNTRSNYDVACAVAKTEALIDVRFYLLKQALAKDGGELATHNELLGALERQFRYQLYLGQLNKLKTICQRDVDRFFGGLGDLGIQASHAVADILDKMQANSEGLYAPGAARRSDFFRDIAGAQYIEHAETFSRDRKIPFELLIGVYDRSIILVENQAEDVQFEKYLEPAMECSWREFPALQDKKDKVWKVLRSALASKVEIVGNVGTGYGRARLPFDKKEIRSEILCHGLGAHYMFPKTATVLDIGGQDTKAIQVDARGVVESFQMNDRCAAGCGRYLGYIADEMNIGLQDLGPLALKATKKVRINSTCTVFAGAELRDRLASGEKREDIVDGLHRAIILRAMSLLARSGGVRDEFTFTGGVAKNPAAVRALRTVVRENYQVASINIHPNSIYTGAIGGALFALRESHGVVIESKVIPISGEV